MAKSLQYDRPYTAAELFSFCGCHGLALENLNCRLSRELSALSKATSEARWKKAVDNIQALSLRAKEHKQGCVTAL